MASRALSASELILQPDGSIYHLHLRPEQVAPLIITVGDPNRVEMVSRYFDRIDHKIQKREFITHTGELNGRRLSVISSGIGPDNIDIVINELDALFNIDLESREIKEEKTRLDLIESVRAEACSPNCPSIVSFFLMPVSDWTTYSFSIRSKKQVLPTTGISTKGIQQRPPNLPATDVCL